MPSLAVRLAQLKELVSENDQQTPPVAQRHDIWAKVSAQAMDHPFLADSALALVVGVVSTAWLANHPGSSFNTWALQAALILPLVLRRRYPDAVFAVLSAVALFQWAMGLELVADLSLLVSLYTLASHRPRLTAAIGAVVVEVGAVMASLRWSLAGSWVRSLVFLSGLVAAAFLLGRNFRSRRGRVEALTERAVQLERERDQQALIATGAERARIAREMHDVIAHSLAVIVSLADGATAKLRTDPSRAADAIANVSAIGRQTLGETRRVLGVLREDDGPEGTAPQPGVAQVDALLEQVRRTGLRVSLRAEGSPPQLPPGEEVTVYRIVQEAVTNVLKHAVGASAVDVKLTYRPDCVEIEVTDNGAAKASTSEPPSRPGGHGSGHGLEGMKERAALYSGCVTAGPSPAGWQVHALLPVPAGR